MISFWMKGRIAHGFSRTEIGDVGGQKGN